VEYIQAYYRIFTKLIAYLQQHYPRGLTWNQDGIDAMSALKQIKSGPTVNGAAAPPPPPLPTFDLSGGPPPPPPPPPGALTGAKPAASGGGDMSSVFEQLNQGSAITSSLRKVDKSEMTHKNPSLRSSSVVPERSDSQTSVGSSNSRGKSPLPSKKPKPESMRVKKPPRKELDGNKWYIEHFENTSDVIEIPAEKMHSIMISRCTKAIIKVNNKANAISIDNCNNLSIIVDSLVSSIDVIKSPKFALQIDGVVPTILLDQVDGAMIYLSQKSLDTEVLTSKCSGMNVILPPKEDTNEDGEECPLPEQFRSYIKDGALVHEIVEHAG
jgi:adenylyl cyclase-associated protein